MVVSPLVSAENAEPSLEIYWRSSKVLHGQPISYEFGAGPLHLNCQCYLGGSPGSGGHHRPDNVPSRRPIEGEPSLRLIGGETPAELDAAGRRGHPAVDRDLPHAPIPGARSQHPGVRVKTEIAN